MKYRAVVDEETSMDLGDAILVDFFPEGSPDWDCFLTFNVRTRSWHGPTPMRPSLELPTKDELLAAIPEAIIARCVAAAITYVRA